MTPDRTIRNTGGYKDYAVAELTESDGVDLSTSTIKAALIPAGTDVYPNDDTDWQSPIVTYPRDGRAEVSLLIEGRMPGDYNLWIDIVDVPTIVPINTGTVRVE